MSMWSTDISRNQGYLIQNSIMKKNNIYSLKRLIRLPVLAMVILFIFTNSVAQRKHVLVYTKNGEGYVHKNIPFSIALLSRLGQENGFLVTVSEDPNVITEQNLKRYDAVIFSNTNNEAFDTDQQRLAFQRYIQAGGGFVGIHSASGSERDWPWFRKMLGGKFLRHPPFQEFTVNVIDRTHPSTAHLGSAWQREDECYFLHHLNPDIHVLLAADLTTVEDDQKEEYPGDVFGDQFPLSWHHTLFGGRQWYTALGHASEDYSDPEFAAHILGGILWVIEKDKPLDYSKASSTLIK